MCGEDAVTWVDLIEKAILERPFSNSTLRKVRNNHPDPSTFTVPGEWYVLVVRLLLTPKGPELEKLAIHTLLLASIPRLG
ncbi:hypothetical protein ANCDUO_22209 [Ancylostoma duodenale]|uniref:Uncharacterized protein n=1 Tax=Ancylostoma duodenale TaxID=51022 RepID=A0A0C2FS14_9BILA|nr:hypothetical protein ANCDUO_22209 [Ancylostoma duodenale]